MKCSLKVSQKFTDCYIQDFEKKNEFNQRLLFSAENFSNEISGTVRQYSINFFSIQHYWKK